MKRFRWLRSIYGNLGLFRKIMLFFCALLFVAITLISLLFWDRYHEIMNAEFSSIAQRNADLIAGNIDSMIDMAGYNSKLLLANTTVQQTLKSDADFANIFILREMQDAVRNYMNITPHVSAIFVFDTHGHTFGLDNYSYRGFSFGRAERAPWYSLVLPLRGYYHIELNSGEGRKLNGDENVISLIRSIYDLDQASRLIGTLMLNLKESLFTSCFTNIAEEGSFFVTVVDSNFVPVLSAGNDFLSYIDAPSLKKLSADQTRGKAFSYHGRKYFYACRKLASAEWYVVDAIPYGETKSSLSGFDSIYWLLVLLIVGMLLLATTVINRTITTPLRQLTEAMKRIERGEFRSADIRTGRDEIGLLKNSFNSMVAQIESLVERIKVEGERKRVAELHALQMQIKPHFLYNTIDTARSMVLSGRNADANVLLRSLGLFYRNSICGGKDVITLGEEIDMVRNYLVIQKMRYGNLLDAAYDVDDALLSRPTLKLVLQPLVENAIYHGIRPTGRAGIVSLRVWDDGGPIGLSVSDNGAGMSAALIDSILSPSEADRARAVREGEGIGLCGTIDRLRLFCGVDNPLEISSDPGYGTRVTIRLPKGGGHE